jgi:hypothetical protein
MGGGARGGSTGTAIGVGGAEGSSGLGVGWATVGSGGGATGSGTGDAITGDGASAGGAGGGATGLGTGDAITGGGASTGSGGAGRIAGTGGCSNTSSTTTSSGGAGGSGRVTIRVKTTRAAPCSNNDAKPNAVRPRSGVDSVPRPSFAGIISPDDGKSGPYFNAVIALTTEHYPPTRLAGQIRTGFPAATLSATINA